MGILVYLVEQRGRGVLQGEILALDELKDLDQSTISQYLTALVREGLLRKGPGKRGAYTVSMQEEVSELIMLAATICAATSEMSVAESDALKRRIRKARMAGSRSDEDAVA